MHLFIPILLFFVSTFTFGQVTYQPTIVILDPFQTDYDESLMEKIDKYNYKNDISAKEEKRIFDSWEEDRINFQIMDKAEFQFAKRMNFGSNFTLSLNMMINYKVLEQSENAIVMPTHDTSDGEIDSLKYLAEKHKVQWIVNPVSLKIFMENGNKFMTARIQVYDAKQNKIELDEEYTGDSENPGFEFECANESLNCNLNNVINPSLNDILITILGSY